MYAKGKYFILQCIVMIISPITSLFVSIRFYKSEVSQLFFVVFAFYFGYHLGFVHDLMNHYRDMMDLYVGRSVEKIIADERIYLLGHDIYHVIFKIIVSRFSTDTQFFGGAACAVYAAFFMFFFRQLKVFYNNNKLTILYALLLITITFIIEFYWYQGLRFRTGVFYFAAIYLKLLNTKNKLYLLALLVTPLIHFTLIMLVAAVLIDYVLRYTGWTSRIVLFAFSIFIRVQDLDFVPLMLKHVPLTRNLSIAVTDDRIRNNWRDHMANIRANGNMFYVHRNDFLLFSGLIILFFLWKYKAFKDNRYGYLITFAMTLFTIANFGYGDLIFYDRFYQAAMLFFYTYLFSMSIIYADRIKNKVSLIALFVIPPMLYAAATQLVEQRQYIFHLDLIFGNFFTAWDGNMQEGIDYDWRR